MGCGFFGFGLEEREGEVEVEAERKGGGGGGGGFFLVVDSVSKFQGEVVFLIFLVCLALQLGNHLD